MGWPALTTRSWLAPHFFRRNVADGLDLHLVDIQETVQMTGTLGADPDEADAHLLQRRSPERRRGRHGLARAGGAAADRGAQCGQAEPRGRGGGKKTPAIDFFGHERFPFDEMKWLNSIFPGSRNL